MSLSLSNFLEGARGKQEKGRLTYKTGKRKKAVVRIGDEPNYRQLDWAGRRGNLKQALKVQLWDLASALFWFLGDGGGLNLGLDGGGRVEKCGRFSYWQDGSSRSSSSSKGKVRTLWCSHLRPRGRAGRSFYSYTMSPQSISSGGRQRLGGVVRGASPAAHRCSL